MSDLSTTSSSSRALPSPPTDSTTAASTSCRPLLLSANSSETPKRRSGSGAAVAFTNVGRAPRSAKRGRCSPISPTAASGGSPLNADTSDLNGQPTVERSFFATESDDDDVLTSAAALLSKMRSARHLHKVAPLSSHQGDNTMLISIQPQQQMLLEANTHHRQDRSLRTPTVTSKNYPQPSVQGPPPAFVVSKKDVSTTTSIGSLAVMSHGTQTTPPPFLRHAWSQCRSFVNSPAVPSAASRSSPPSGKLSEEDMCIRLLCELDVCLTLLLPTPG